MKLSQSNFNLRLPDCYLVRYLIAIEWSYKLYTSQHCLQYSWPNCTTHTFGLQRSHWQNDFFSNSYSFIVLGIYNFGFSEDNVSILVAPDETNSLRVSNYLFLGCEISEFVKKNGSKIEYRKIVNIVSNVKTSLFSFLCKL